MNKDDFCLIVTYEELPNIKLVPRKSTRLGNSKVEMGEKLLTVKPIYLTNKKLKTSVNVNISKKRLIEVLEPIFI